MSTATMTGKAAPVTTPSTAQADMSADPVYWWRTSGHDLATMLADANYAEETQRQFLLYYRDFMCTQLGSKPNSSSGKAGMAWDGNPFEYSFELRNSTEKLGVRFSVDFAEVRKQDWQTTPLATTATNNVLSSLAERTSHFDDTWHRHLMAWLTHADLSPEEQQGLTARVGHQLSVMLGFDISTDHAASGRLPLMAKSYFTVCFTALRHGITPWEAATRGVLSLPGIESLPNISSAWSMLDAYLASKPGLTEDVRGLATDLVAPGKARLKVYMRFLGDSFEELWDYYTLGGRISDIDGSVEDDKEVFRDLMCLTCGPAGLGPAQTNGGVARYKPTAVYFSLSPTKPFPIPKIYFYPARTAPNDQAIARGLDSWLTKYGWNKCGGKTMEQKVGNMFTHRKLEDNTGLFTYLGLGKGKGNGLSLQVYLTPELYETPRA